MTMATGTVQWWSMERGYGFIAPALGGKDIYVHHTGIDGGGDLRKGQSVEYEIVDAGPKGPRAVGVVIMADPE